MSEPRARRLLVEAAKLYYVEGLSQDETARALSMTRSNVSRVLRAARDAGVVEIRVHDAWARDAELQTAIRERFGLKDVAVATSEAHADGQEGANELGAEVFMDAVAPARLVAVSWGTTLQSVVECLPQVHWPKIEVVQLVGGLVSFDSRATAHDVVRELAHRLGSRYRYLNSPAVFDSAAALCHLLAESSVQGTLESARRADVALVGIGSPSSGSSATLLDLLKLSASERALLLSQEPVGDVCGRYYDLQGNPVAFPALHDRILAVELDDLRAIPVVIGVAWGRDKAAAVLGALRAHLVDVLVCDQALGRATLELDRRSDPLAP